ncbi:MAG: type III pantothenate kinase [Candidatus Wallbacteria bacterium]|nr:type III pantothenate kinase [Candidatus Wallbacteria bacterium]
MKTILVDIGNTCIKGCETDGRHLLRSFSCQTKDVSKSSFFTEFEPELCLVCSVVPEALEKLREIGPKIRILAVGQELKPEIKSAYDLTQLGADRLLNIWTAGKIYTPPLLVVSAGTALTVDYINPDGFHEGGLICSGIRSGLRSLSENTAALFETGLHKPDSLWALNTADALNNGFCNQAIFFIKKIPEQLPGRTKTIITGGDSSLIDIQESVIFPELALQGLLMLLMELSQEHTISV